MEEERLHDEKRARQPALPRGSGRKLAFGEDRAFQTELRRRVDEWLHRTGRRPRGGWRLHLKTAIILSCFAGSYALLVFVARAWWQAVPLAVLLGLATAGIGTNIQHDGGHRAYSDRRWVNRAMAATLDLIGGSSHVWHWKHTLVHHTYVNITGYDTDIDLGRLARLSPHQERLAFHRWQHLYLWPLYGLLAVKWQLLTDFRHVATGRLCRHSIPRPKGWDLVLFVVGKAAFFTWAFAVPMLFHPIGVVLLYYCVAAGVLGLVLSVVFQLPHCVPQADFPLPREGTERMENPWAVHQASVTLDFARSNRALGWLVGGLNFHLEHHLFPVICHTHYPGLSGIVEQTCRDLGVKYAEHESFCAGVAEHYRWLRQMGSR